MDNTHFPRKNLRIWTNWSALPRLRVLDRKGYTNDEIKNYLIKRFGWDDTCESRNLSYQVYHYRRRTSDDWKTYRLLKASEVIPTSDGNLIPAPIKSARLEPHEHAARKRVFEAFRRGRRILADEMRDARITELPPGYSYKWTWKYNFHGTIVQLMAVPPLGTEESTELLQQGH